MVRTIDTLVGKMSMLRVASEISIYVTLWSTVTGVQGSDLCSVWLVQPASVRPSGRHPHPAMHASPALSTTPPTNQPTKPTGRTGRARAASREPRSRTSSGGGRRRVGRRHVAWAARRFHGFGAMIGSGSWQEASTSLHVDARWAAPLCCLHVRVHAFDRRLTHPGRHVRPV